MRKGLLLVLILGVIGAAALVLESQRQSPKVPVNSLSPAPAAQPTTVAEAGFDKTLFSTSEPGSLWWIVNKTRPLPEGYVPPELTVPDVPLRLTVADDQSHVQKQVVPDLERLFAAAKEAGYSLILASGYRSETYQRQLYTGYVASQGQAAADRVSARPGTSEHQTGLSMDLGRADRQCELEQCFGATDEGIWLAKNAHTYGFLVRYPEGKEAITGYSYEPWHFRYVGAKLATELYGKGLALEEFFSLPAAPSYQN